MVYIKPSQEELKGVVTMLQQVFTITIVSSDTDGLAGANLVLKQAKELIAEHVDCILEISDITSVIK